MDRNEGLTGAGFALGVVAGAIVGAGVALLFAPKPGRELRQDLGESMGNLRKTVTDKYNDLSSRASAAFEHAEAKAEKAVDRAVDAVEGGARQFAQEVGGRTRNRV